MGRYSDWGFYRIYLFCIVCFNLQELMMERVKFRKGVTEEVRQEVREFMRDKVFYEADTGMAASLAPMFTYLTEKGYHAVFHVDCIEIVPIEEWVKEEIASFPPKSAAFYGYILHDHLVRMGFPSEKVNEWMKG
jgi:hypothetical protein